MRFSVIMTACALCLASEAALRFSEPVWRADLGIALPGLVGAVGEPLDMPRAESYLVSEAGAAHLEDRYETFDLWTLATLRGRWSDAAGNRLWLARLDTRPPEDAPGVTRTRRAARAAQADRAVDPKNVVQRDEAAAAISPVDLGRAVRPRRMQRRNIANLTSYVVTNDHALAFAFRPVDAANKCLGPWFLAVLEAAPEEDMDVVRARFDEDFLDRISIPPAAARRSLPKPPAPLGKDATEDELLRADVRAQVANYDEWASVDAADVTVLDDLDPLVRAAFIPALTNGLPRLRRAYAACAPSSLAGTNALAVVRVFRSREEYLAYVGVEQKWTAALWSPLRRELVLYHPEGGTESLLRTVWHEAFHQYMAYAGAMIDSAPWFNEGHAQLFEYARFDRDGAISFGRDERAAEFVRTYAVELAEMLPAVMEMDYRAFYDGTQEEIAAKYDLAWSIAYFLEVGAPKLRFQPYANLRADYMAALVKTRSMHKATRAVFEDEKGRDRFVAAWLAFWRER